MLELSAGLPQSCLAAAFPAPLPPVSPCRFLDVHYLFALLAPVAISQRSQGGQEELGHRCGLCLRSVCLAGMWLLEGESSTSTVPATSIPCNDFSPVYLSFCVYWKKEDDVRIEAFEDDSEAEGSGGEMDIKELRAKKQALARKVAEQQRRQDKIQVGLAGRGAALLGNVG